MLSGRSLRIKILSSVKLAEMKIPDLLQHCGVKDYLIFQIAAT